MSVQIMRANFTWLLVPLALTAIVSCELTESTSRSSRKQESQRQRTTESAQKARKFDFRGCFEPLINPYGSDFQFEQAGPNWKGAQSDADIIRKFWDRQEWEKTFRQLSDEGFNAIIYAIWHLQWPTYLIENKEFPEAREYTPEQYKKLIEHVNWIFNRARELGLKNYLVNYHIAVPPAFAKAHGIDKQMPESLEVHESHNGFLKNPRYGGNFGVRNELTRKYTEAATAELFQTYPALDGFYGEMGEPLPGKRSSWYKEAIVPGFKRSGRKPIYIVQNWMMPLEDFLEDVAPPGLYDNTWMALMPNGEMFTDARPYPNYVDWVEKGGVPTVMAIHMHNYEGGFPFNSPRLAYEMVREFDKVENCVGFSSQLPKDDPNELYRKALAYYGRNLDEPYSDDPWINILEARFGDREAARRLLHALDIAARIPPEVCALAFHPTDGYQGRLLGLRYFFFTDDDPRYTGWYTSPSRSARLLPVRRYAQIVARFGSQWRGTNGGDVSRPPWSQRHNMGLADYTTIPETHMRKIRKMGEDCLRAAQEAMKTVKQNRAEAEAIYNYMKAYQLLTIYYEKKVLAAISALIYHYGGPAEERALAERHADEAVQLYEAANQFIWENIDRKSGRVIAKWSGENTLPQLLELEKEERSKLGSLFKWSASSAAMPQKRRQ